MKPAELQVIGPFQSRMGDGNQPGQNESDSAGFGVGGGDVLCQTLYVPLRYVVHRGPGVPEDPRDPRILLDQSQRFDLLGFPILLGRNQCQNIWHPLSHLNFAKAWVEGLLATVMNHINP